MSFANLYVTTGAVILGLMTVLWIISLMIRNASIADVFWGMGFVIVSCIAFTFAPQGFFPRKLLACSMVALWGLRLTVHIGVRNKGKPEDFRYAQWRVENGLRWWWLSYFKVFALQGFLMWVISAPLIATQYSVFPTSITPLDWLGASIWIFGLLFETIGDLQLTHYKADKSNKGKILTLGLWKFTRHPNYFGEAVLWWGIYLVTVAAGFWWTIFSPVLMTLLLLKVSGVAMLERTMKSKPGYEEYMRKTNTFVPWFPKS